MAAALIRIAIIEDVRETREGLAELIGGWSGFCVSGVYGSMEAALAGMKEQPDLALVDNGLPGMDGVSGIEVLKLRFAELPILMLTVFDDSDTIFAAICAGAVGYLLKDTPATKLKTAIEEVVAGGAPMSPSIARKVIAMLPRVNEAKQPSRLSKRETEVLQLFAQGHSYKSTAAALNLSVDTVRSHIRNLYERLNVHTKSEAVKLAALSGWIR